MADRHQHIVAPPPGQGRAALRSRVLRPYDRQSPHAWASWLAPPLFGTITAVMTLVGLQLGRAAARLIRIRSDLLTGVALVVMAVLVQRGVIN